MIVREMKEQDIEAVAALEAQIFSDSWSRESIKASLDSNHVRMLVSESKERGAIVGYHIFYRSLDEGDVARIAVQEQYRGAGIAEQLLEAMWLYCQEQKISRVLLEVRESNVAAISLYKKHDFMVLGTRKNYYREPLENGIIMEKQIDITTSIS